MNYKVSLSLNRQELRYLNNKINSLPKDDAHLHEIKMLSLIRKALTRRRYGLVWEPHTENVDLQMRNNIPVFDEIPKYEIHTSQNKHYNFLIEGDNLHTLHLLHKSNADSIDVIYIDPPYNTGSKDFIYNDHYVDNDDQYKHSKWLSFMNRRLKIARTLLKPSGVILISIDAHEVSQLKLLMDQIFGEDHLAAEFHVETSAVAGPRRAAAMKGSVVKQAEFVLAYTKDNEDHHRSLMKRLMYDHVQGYDTHYNQIIDPKTHNMVKLQNYIKQFPKLVKCFTDLSIDMNKKSNPTLKDIDLAERVSPTFRKWLHDPKISKRIYRNGDKVSKKDRKNYINNAVMNTIHKYGVSPYGKNGTKLASIGTNGKLDRVYRYYNRLGWADDENGQRVYGERTIRGNLWKGFEADGGNVAKEGGVKFKNGKKPLRLIEELIEAVSKPNKLTKVLDFFAGSGTTGEAVEKLNQAHKGHYRFILATDSSTAKVSLKRMQNTSKRIPLNMEYFKDTFIPKKDNHLTSDLLKYVKEMIEVQHYTNLDHSSYALVTTPSEAKNQNLNNIKIVYMKRKLHTLLALNDQLEQKYEKFIANHGKIVNVPDSFFENELEEHLTLRR